MRGFAPTALLAIGLAGAAGAAEVSGSGGRYSLAPSPEGFIRLDTATGATSHCAYRDGAWTCERLGEADAALRTRLDALAAEVGRLSAAVAELKTLAGRRATNEPPSAAVPQTPPTASFSERVVDRLMEMVRRLKYGEGAAT